MDVSDYVRILRRSWRLILGTLLLIVVIAGVVTATTPREYRAETQLFVSTLGGDTVTDLAQGGSFAQRQVTTYADIVSAPVVLDSVVADLGLEESARHLADRVSASVAPGTVLITVTVADEDPEAAAQIANAVANRFAVTVADLERADDSASSSVKATVVRPAVAPEGPASPKPVRNIGLAVLVGLVLGVGLAVLRDVLDTRIRGEADIREATPEPILGAITYDADAAKHPLIREADAGNSRSEAFRGLRTNLLYLDPDHRPRVLLITSSVVGEGKSSSATNLALTIGATGSTVCLVEGDLRRPRVMDYLGLENAAGVTEVLVGRAEIADVVQPYRDNVHVLGCGQIPPNPSELLGSAAMKHLIQQLSADYDYVILDGSPLMAVTDSAILSTVADGAIVVVGVGIVKRDELRRTLAGLDRVGAKVLGLVANRLPVKGPDAYRPGQGAYYYQSAEAQAR